MTSVVGGRLGGWQAVQSADAGSRRDHETVCFRGSRARPATRGRVAVGCGIRDGVTWRRKGATVSVIILVLFIAVIVASVGAFIMLITALFIVPALNIRAGVLARLFGPKMAPRQQLQRLWVALRFMTFFLGSILLGWMFVPMTQGLGFDLSFPKSGPGALSSAFLLQKGLYLRSPNPRNLQYC